MKNFPSLLLVLLILSCSPKTKLKRTTILEGNAFLLTEYAQDKEYGYSEKKPIEVGGVLESAGPLNERRFLNGLLGPEGEPVEYERQGSCCAFETLNGIMGYGMLDIYLVYHDGLEDPVKLYINMYDEGPLMIPNGFSARQP